MASSTFGSGHDSISASTWFWSVRQSNTSAALPWRTTPSQTAKASQASAPKPGKCFFCFFICSNLLKLRHLGEENVAITKPSCSAPPHFRQQLDDARFTQFASDSPCDDPTRFATRSPTYGSYRAVPERRRHFLRKSGGRRTFSPARGCVWIPLLRKKTCCPQGSQDADAGGPFEDHCRGIKLRRPCAGIGQTPPERA